MGSLSTVKERIKEHEGKRRFPYKDSEGILTVGYGRNLEAVPFSDDELDLMFENDFRAAVDRAESFFVYPSLNEVRRGVLIEMIYQMGAKGVAKFVKFLDAAAVGDWQKAHDEMLESRWANQTPERAEKLAKIFLNG